MGNGSNDALLEDSSVFGSDVLLLRTIHGSAASETAVHTDTNFASSLAGQRRRGRAAIKPAGRGHDQ
jgi:hypothetical protein